MPEQPPACCDLGRVSDRGYDAPPPRRYTDAFGFTYRLCERHYVALVTGLLRAEHNRRGQRFGGRPWTEPPRYAHVRRPPGSRKGAQATAGELARAREQAGYSLRQLGDALGYSRSQLQAAEVGRRPVGDVVARWVRQVLDGVDGVDESGTVETESRDAPARR